MGAVTYRAAAELRRSLRGGVAIALLVALLGGVVLAAVAGARRTASAYPRMLAAAAAPELLVSPPGAEGVDPTPFYDALREVDGVRDVGVISGMGVLPLAGTPTEDLAESLGDVGFLGVFFGAVDGRYGYELRRPIVTEGRLPAPDALDEVFLSRNVAERTGLAVGDPIDVVVLDGDRIAAATEPLAEDALAAEAEHGTVLHLTVVGTGTSTNEIITYTDLDQIGHLLVPPAVAALQRPGDEFFGGALVDLDAGSGRAEVVDAINALAEREELGTGGPVFISDERAQAETVQDGLRPLAVALTAFAVSVALVALVVVGQALARHTREAPGDHVVLRAMGAPPRQRALVPIVRAAVLSVAGALGAVVVAVALSPRFPIGPARLAERESGVAVDAPVLGLGALGIVVLVAASMVPVAGLAVRRSRPGGGGVVPAATSAAWASGMPAPVVQGLRFAFGARSDGSTPTRSALLVSVLAVAAVLGTAGFASGLTGVVDVPRRYGQGWDALLDGSFGPAPVAAVARALAEDQRVDGVAVGNYGELEVDGVPVPAIELRSLAGDAGIVVVEGEVADDPGEVVLGGEVLDDLDAAVGDTVEVGADAGAGPYTVVGRAAFPRLGRGSFDGTGLGVGAQVAPGPLGPLDGEATLEDLGVEPGDFSLDGRLYAFLTVDAGGDVVAATTALEEVLATVDGASFYDVKGALQPTTIRELDRVRAVPAALAAVLALVAVAALAHQLSCSVRERRSELLLLRALGFAGSQLRATVLSSAALLTVVAVGLGVPLGLALGRVAWRSLADRLYLGAWTPTPWGWVVLALPVALVVAGTVGLLPARRAGRAPAALVRTTEVRR